MSPDRARRLAGMLTAAWALAATWATLAMGAFIALGAWPAAAFAAVSVGPSLFAARGAWRLWKALGGLDAPPRAGSHWPGGWFGGER